VTRRPGRLLMLWAGLTFLLAIRAFAGALLPPAVAVRVEPCTVDVNTASVAELQALPGVGETRAAAIVLERIRHGPFADAAALQRVDGIGPESCELLRPFARFGPSGN